MEINLLKAITTFFPSPSLEMIYFEAVANSIDAGASKIDIGIFIDEFTKSETLEIKISDNGIGFVEKNFQKFSKLLETEDQNHKGLGRLVFLNYFENVTVISHYDNTVREFLFSADFQGVSKTAKTQVSMQKTEIILSNYSKQSVRTYDYLRPETIIDSIIMQFFPMLHAMKISKKDLEISVSLKTNQESKENRFFNCQKDFFLKDLPELKSISFSDPTISLIDDFILYYSIENTLVASAFHISVCAEGRTIPLNFIKSENIPLGYEIHFLLLSSYFNGKVNPSRQKLDIEEREMKVIKRVLTQKMIEIINQDIPAVAEKNKKTKEVLEERFPHLHGYFEDCAIGLIDREKTLEIAQKKFFSLQKEILECSHLNEDLYFKSLNISSRVLAEYIIYRSKIISKLKDVNKNQSEADIHNLFVPRRKIFSNATQVEEIFAHNAWLLDDKFMSYSKILSEQEMSKVIHEISFESESITDDSRPDIAIIFSNPPLNSQKVDIVIVELKKKGLPLAKNEEVISQLKQRARKLLNYYGKTIQRVWFYGIVEFDKELRRSLKEEKFIEVFSCGEVYYKEHEIYPDFDDDNPIPVGLNVLSFEALFRDADARNNTFLNILKGSIRKSTQPTSQDSSTLNS
ncbi:MAG: sensor histidine kinase [Candidatus Riflebacteria bacterium]|nr:sensor histidine kinase [Candidatus Riflebacteria bacterium]